MTPVPTQNRATTVGTVSSKLIDLEVPVPEPPRDLDVRSGPRIPVLGNVTPHGTIRFGGPRRLVVRFAAILASMSFIVFAEFHSTDPWLIAYAGAAIVVISVAGSFATALTWIAPGRLRPLVVAAYFALSFVMWPLLQWNVCILWLFPAIVIGVSMLTSAATLGFTVVLMGLAFVFQYLSGERGLGLLWVPAIVASVSLMMSAFSRQAASIVQLQQTRHELAQLAVAEERGRVARDMHDILGHSLTAIAVKAELAGMLIGEDASPRVRDEISAVEQLARAALADVRTTVAGYRGTSVAAELANARSVLASVGIETEFPATVESLPLEDRELAGWFVREAVTNVLRHSGAKVCRIEVAADLVQVVDDGRGPGATSTPRSSTGSGLRGLAERVAAGGWMLETGRSELGGFRVAMVRGAVGGGVVDPAARGSVADGAVDEATTDDGEKA
ncbi:sensor histidine kinase [Humibacter ginsenosidimutans]|uniref:Sensor histidine kinase n=1 Tax=Humibacter ginsenosidimutans TaxID=2599293 RepID=A0A5B8M9E0_9MICO|nr:sensor histidine kinase [Humibacter ginsenosidimutans]